MSVSAIVSMTGTMSVISRGGGEGEGGKDRDLVKFFQKTFFHSSTE